ncbi:hypothetical protein B296_00053768 [Ensete ventricosum]|uniref:Uncharacterized protein n=1 Tax=Ensete ventricosum TaxID=4639 RepID=A0A426Y6K0_ENSVE|nr:hypothetical protein B296_00053768 [Ensete ventricosum]
MASRNALVVHKPTRLLLACIDPPRISLDVLPDPAAELAVAEEEEVKEEDSRREESKSAIFGKNLLSTTVLTSNMDQLMCLLVTTMTRAHGLKRRLRDYRRIEEMRLYQHTLRVIRLNSLALASHYQSFLLLTWVEANNERVQAGHTIILERSAKDEDPDCDKGDDDDEGAISTLGCS